MKRTNMLTGKERKKRKNEQVFKVKQRQMKIYIHQRLTAGEKNVGKANKKINVEKI